MLVKQIEKDWCNNWRRIGMGIGCLLQMELGAGLELGIIDKTDHWKNWKDMLMFGLPPP